MTVIHPDSSHGRASWLTAILMADYANRVRIEDSDLRLFEARWNELVQPVIDKKQPPPDYPRRWRSFALNYHYLAGEGFHLPLFSKPWAAAIRSFLSILGTECPSSHRREAPHQWSSEIHDPRYSHPPITSIPTEFQLDEIRTFLSKILTQSESYSLNHILEKILDEEWDDIPHDYSVAAYLKQGVVAHQRPTFGDQKSSPIQSILIGIDGGGKTTRELSARYEEARRAALKAQVKILIQSLSGSRGEKWTTSTMERLSACLLCPKEPGSCPALDPKSDYTGASLIATKSFFPGSLSKAEWLLKEPQLRKSPDTLKLWIAYNWVNPQAPFWMMKASAIYSLLKYTRLGVSTSEDENFRKKEEQGRIREAISYLELPKYEPTPPITDFLPAEGWMTNGYRAERLHEMASVSINGTTILGAARVTRETFSRLTETADPDLLAEQFRAK